MSSLKGISVQCSNFHLLVLPSSARSPLQYVMMILPLIKMNATLPNFCWRELRRKRPVRPFLEAMYIWRPCSGFAGLTIPTNSTVLLAARRSTEITKLEPTTWPSLIFWLPRFLVLLMKNLSEMKNLLTTWLPLWMISLFKRKTKLKIIDNVRKGKKSSNKIQSTLRLKGTSSTIALQ